MGLSRQLLRGGGQETGKFPPAQRGAGVLITRELPTGWGLEGVAGLESPREDTYQVGEERQMVGAGGKEKPLKR